MSVDMFVSKFRRRLMELQPYHDHGLYDPSAMHASIPAMRAAFSAAALFCHDAGYTLPEFDLFLSLYSSAARLHYDFARKFAPFFDGDTPADGLLYRLSVAYESYMAEAYLNVCLIEAIEDRLKQGVVLYDPRADWKMKWDSLVLCKGRVFVINSYWQGSGRRSVEARREATERRTKINTAVSSHWGNVEIGAFE